MTSSYTVILTEDSKFRSYEFLFMTVAKQLQKDINKLTNSKQKMYFFQKMFRYS